MIKENLKILIEEEKVRKKGYDKAELFTWNT